MLAWSGYKILCISRASSAIVNDIRECRSKYYQDKFESSACGVRDGVDSIDQSDQSKGDRTEEQIINS